MSADVALVIGSALLSFSIAYALWGKVRVMGLRQDIFDIRDELFDQAARLGRIDDPAYRQARDHLNSLTRWAGTISIPTLIYLFSKDDERKPRRSPALVSTSPELQRLIDRAYGRASQRLAQYLLFHTLTGLAVWVGASLFSYAPSTQAKVEERIEESVRPGSPMYPSNMSVA